jgi:small subunit ribosomal protein S4
MPKRKRKKYSKPRRPFDKVRMDEEDALKEKYGLKNKREIWRADSEIGEIRSIAKKLITAEKEDQKAFIERLQKKGFQVESIADSLALDKEDWLKRRLQTIVYAKKLANTPNQARQFITHRHVKIKNQIVNKPSYQVSLQEEAEVEVDLSLKEKPEEKSKVEEIKEQVEEKKEEVEETDNKQERGSEASKSEGGAKE